MYFNYWQLENIFQMLLGTNVGFKLRIGAPGYPEKLLWKTKSGLTVDKTEVEFDNKGVVRVESTLSNLKKIKVTSAKGTGTDWWLKFYYDGSLEASLHLTLDDSNEKVTIVMTAVQDTSADLTLEVSSYSSSQAQVKFSFNSNNYTSIVDKYTEEIPQCLTDVLDAIKTYSPSIDLYSLQLENWAPFAMSYIGRSSQEGGGDRALDWRKGLAAGLGDVLGGSAAGPVGAVLMSIYVSEVYDALENA